MSNTVLLGEIASLKTGPFGTQLSASEYVKEGIPVINVRNIGYGEIITSDLEYVGEETAKRLYEHLLHKGDIVFGRKGSVDRHAFIDTRYDGWMQGSDCIRVRINEGINPHFISHNLKLESVKKQINSSAIGSTMASLNTDILSRIQIVLPSLEIQNRIEELLSVIEEKIDLNTRLCAKLEAMAKTLYDYWFVQFDFPDENGKPYRTSGGAMEWCQELGREVPKGWKAKRVSELTKVITGKEDANFSTADGEYKFFTCGQETLCCDTPAFTGKAVLIAGNGDFNVKHYTGSFNAYQRTYVLIPNEDKYYAAMFIAAKDTIQSFRQGSNGSIVKFITKGDVENITLLSPTNDDLLQRLNGIIEQIELFEKENDELIKLRDWLLPMLMNGQAFIH